MLRFGITQVFYLRIIFKSSQDLQVLCLTLGTNYSFRHLSGISICTWRIEFKDYLTYMTCIVTRINLLRIFLQHEVVVTLYRDSFNIFDVKNPCSLTALKPFCDYSLVWLISLISAITNLVIFIIFFPV